ncbi:TIM barrel protein [Brachybacterium hainanense]|uniref:TIM barrel protein n=1 Tax=Brachybacterium hainanense TaxID=1541174 RepID=A0ABV6RBN2_9MICO
MSRVVNLSTVFRGLPRDERPAAAAAAGWTRVESWWEFASATPDQDDLARFLSAIEEAGVELVAINAHGGDRDAGERGLAGLLGREEEFRASIEGIASVHARTGARSFNVTIGNVSPQVDREQLLALAAARYRWACERVRSFGGTLLLEPLTADGNPDYPFRTGYDVAEFLEERLAGVPNIGLLLDTYHLASNGVDPAAAARDLAPIIRHVQFADAPGRGAPGTGDIDFPAVERALAEAGYTGDIAHEHLG